MSRNEDLKILINYFFLTHLQRKRVYYYNHLVYCIISIIICTFVLKRDGDCACVRKRERNK